MEVWLQYIWRNDLGFVAIAVLVVVDLLVIWFGQYRKLFLDSINVNGFLTVGIVTIVLAWKVERNEIVVVVSYHSLS